LLQCLLMLSLAVKSVPDEDCDERDALQPNCDIFVRAEPTHKCTQEWPPAQRYNMKKSDLLRALQNELRRHDFSTFLTEEPSMAEGGPGVVVPGCPACRKDFERS
jgi:hypothetical protein